MCLCVQACVRERETETERHRELRLTVIDRLLNPKACKQKLTVLI